MRSVQVSRMLLAWGANPGAVDAANKTARSAADGKAGLEDLLALWDEHGAVAFEDAPGTWQRSSDADSGALLPA